MAYCSSRCRQKYYQTKIVQLIEILQSRKENIEQLTTWAYLGKGKITVIELTSFNEKFVAG